MKSNRRVPLTLVIAIAIFALISTGVAGCTLGPNQPFGNGSISTSSSAIGNRGPSGNVINSTASSIVTNIQMASAVDPNTAGPAVLATVFHTYNTIYTTFMFDFSNTNVNPKNPGYVEGWYYDHTTKISDAGIWKFDNSTASGKYTHLQTQLNQAVTAGTVEVYWCRQADCIDRKLAGLVNFTVID